ncbi:MAG: Obg family GTPase CgtA, partial [Rubrobacteraceae bacterium]
LIEGASEGRGLGNQFLRHVARARVLALVLDASEDPEGAEGVLRAELYAAGLSQTPTVVALNKIDLLDEELREYLNQEFPEASQVSAETGEGLEAFRDVLEEKVRELGEPVAEANGSEEAHRIFRPTWRGMRVENEGTGVYRISGEEIERTALKTDWENPEGVERFQRELEKKGIVAALRRAGAETGDEVRIGEVMFDFQ